MGEFDLIARHFTRAAPSGSAVVLGVGDDGALLQPTPGHQLVISSDMLVEGRHFFPGADPERLGHKALAVNLSDLAAMGARPIGFTLALALPEADDTWLAGFAKGLFALADACACPLVGGDTTRGPLNLCITVFGEVLPGRALRRDAALPGDDLWLSGRTGEARLALALRRGEAWARGDLASVAERMDRPTPRLALGQALAGIDGVHAALDVSDGLLGDLGHILRASGVGADVFVDALPVAPALRGLDERHRLDCMVAGGDDYELLFSASTASAPHIDRIGTELGLNVTRIGRLVPAEGLRLIDATGQSRLAQPLGFDHFGSH
ncbi:MAG: thiamine-phosphate kinase [Hydrogenophaga sp.]|uniref:thiamine-phosphate kinase n=1 Tax=Hydrogenophaga sp. TaxID=1904254 RepID=UPI001D97081A|nr:thiamine-phosphate kinase [Hydrogenophaga sp.]MBX3611857.1 thiamine-phosphate kinase [Hydrogenophaga sp.]